MNVIDYAPPPTVERWMLDDSEVKALVGPYGSGKTAGAIFEMFRRSMEQQPDANGVRWTRWAVIRNTLAQLKATVLPDMQAYLGDLIRWRVSDNKVVLDFMLADGTRVRSDWLFIPLEEQEDVRRLLSLNLTGVFIEEFREVDDAMLKDIRGRCGRFPSMGGVKATWQGVLMVSNPYAAGSGWHEKLEVERPDGWALYRQPSGLSPEAENVDKLRPGYYESLCDGATEEWIKVHVHGLNGRNRSGSAVFGDSFSRDFHVSRGVRWQRDRPFVIGLDTDRNPAALVGQMIEGGRLLVLAELVGEGMGIEAFVRQKLTPLMYERFPGRAWVVGDPSGVRRSSISEESTFQALGRLGYDAVPASTNRIEPRLRAVEERLASQIGGGPAITIDEKGCPKLIRALAMEYKYARSKRGELSPLPEKMHPWSDLADALQYLCLGCGAARVGNAMMDRARHQRPRSERQRVSAAGWT